MAIKINLPKLNKEQQKNAALIVVASCAILYFYWAYLLKPVEVKIKKTQKEVADLEGQVANAKVQAARLPQIQRDYEALKVVMVNIEKQLPKDKDFPELLRTITREAQRFRLRIANLTPGGITDQGVYQTFPIQLSMSGRFHNIGRFLTAMGTKDRIISAENLKLNLQSASESDATIQTNFSLLAYISKG